MDQNPESLAEEVRHDKVVSNEVLIGTLAIIVLVLLGVIGYMALGKHAPQTGTETATSTAASSASGSDTGKIDEHAAYYDISAAYPVTTDLASPANAEAVNAMKQFVLDSISQFKTQGNFANLTPADVQMQNLDQHKEALDITYRAASGNGDFSYIFTTSEDTLGAHPNTTYKTFVFNGKTGAQMSLADLFPSGTAYLTLLSSKTRALLPAIIAKNEGVAQKGIDTKMMLDGTSASADTFADWYLEGTDLDIIFPPYAVAPYSAGTQTVRIPVAQLGSAKAPAQVNDFGTIY